MTDAIPPRVRTTVYVATLVYGALGTAVGGAVTVLAAYGYMSDRLAATIVAIIASLSVAVATITGGLGTAYRPTGAQQSPFATGGIVPGVSGKSDAIPAVLDNGYVVPKPADPPPAA